MDKKITRPRRRASRLLARLLGADLVSGTYLEFVKMHAGYLLFTNMKSLFTNTLLIRVTGDNSLVMKFNLMQFICIPFAYTLGAFYIRRRSLPRAAAWGMGFSALFYAVFFLSLNHLVWMLPLPKKLRLSESGSPAALAANNLFHLALAGVCIIIIISSKYNPFIYFRF